MVVSREEVLAAIRREAEAAGGVAPGVEKFARVTGIRTHEWSGVYWARWGDALAEAGYEANVFGGANRSDDELGRVLAEQVRRFGRWPAKADMQLAKRSGEEVPNPNSLLRRLGGTDNQRAFTFDWASAHEGWDDVAAILRPLLTSAAGATAKPTGVRRVTGSVYLMKSGKHHKIGRSNHVGRRSYEVAIQLPERLDVIHEIETDDPEGIEAYWHRRFASKRANGEWFSLAPEDVAAFTSRSYM